MDHLLTPWEKIAIIFVGGSIAGLTLLVVVCLVCPTCFFYRILNKSKYRKVTSSSMSLLVAHFKIFRRLVKGKFDAYVL